jgi:hypothetical protein
MALGRRDEWGRGAALSISRRPCKSGGQHAAWSSTQLSSDNDWFAWGLRLKKPSGHRSQLLTTQKRAGSLRSQEKLLAIFLILKGRITVLRMGARRMVRLLAAADDGRAVNRKRASG